MRFPLLQTWIKFPQSSWRGITKKEMSEKVRKRGCEGAVVDGTMAPSGTWWTTLGPWLQLGLSRNIEHLDGLTLLGVEFAVEDGFDHGEIQPKLTSLSGR